MENYNTRENCRVCQSNLEDILSLGNQHLVGFTYPDIDASEQGYPHVAEKPVYVPLDLVLCSNCHLLQLKHTTEPKLLWNENYGYKSGVNETMRKELSSVVRAVEGLKRLQEGDVVVDIGSNDGTLLDNYAQGIIKVGYEPSRNVASLSDLKTGKLFIDFFSRVPFLQEFARKKAKIVTAISMFYDLDNPNGFLSSIKEILHPEGILIIQQNYLVGMLEQCAFDNVVHEHLEYYSLETLENILKNHDLEVFDVVQTSINGGSFRTLVKFKDNKIKSSGGIKKVEEMRSMEKKLSLGDTKTYLHFAQKVKKITYSLKNFIKKQTKKGNRIYIYGASTRGNTLVQACGLDYRFIKAAAERNQDKWGKKIASTGIPIISEEQARKDHPDYFLVLPWFFKQEFLDREKEYLISGGKMIFPLPNPEIVSFRNGKIEIKPI